MNINIEHSSITIIFYLKSSQFSTYKLHNELLNDPIYIRTHAQKPFKPKYPDKPKLLQKGQYMY
jgi:hypothetical protein